MSAPNYDGEGARAAVAESANTLSSLFDVVVELREADDGSREVRVVGHPGVLRTWQPY